MRQTTELEMISGHLQPSSTPYTINNAQEIRLIIRTFLTCVGRKETTRKVMAR